MAKWMSTVAPRQWWLTASGLFLLRVGIAVWAPLGDDEGYYWVWSKHLALSYFDHPPLVAWLVATSTSVLGVSLFSLRLPFVILGTLTALTLRGLIKKCIGDSRLADTSSLLFQVVPVFFGIGFMVLPDASLLLYWLLTGLLFWQAQQGDKRWAWLGTGAALGGALLSKYVGVLFVISLAGYLITTQSPRAFKKMSVICALGILLFVPVLWWNAHHHWASFRYQFVARHHGSGLDGRRFSLFLGSQAIYLSPVLFLLSVCSALRLGPWRLRPEARGEHFFWWLAFPTLGLFALAAAISDFKPNWPAPAYLTLLPLSLLSLARWRQRAPKAAGRIFTTGLVLTLAFTALPTLHLFHPYLPLPQGNDPTADMRGWDEAANQAQRAWDQLRVETATSGGAPFFAAGRYQLASRLEFYLPAHPSVVCLNLGHDAYDDWQHLSELRGANFIFVASDRFPESPERVAIFDSSKLFARVVARAGPSTTHTITLYQCWRFRPLENPTVSP